MHNSFVWVDGSCNIPKEGCPSFEQRPACNELQVHIRVGDSCIARLTLASISFPDRGRPERTNGTTTMTLLPCEGGGVAATDALRDLIQEGPARVTLSIYAVHGGGCSPSPEIELPDVEISGIGVGSTIELYTTIYEPKSPAE